MLPEHDAYFNEVILAKLKVHMPESLKLGNLPERIEKIVQERYFEFFNNVPTREILGDRLYIDMVIENIKRRGNISATNFVLGIINELKKINNN